MSSDPSMERTATAATPPTASLTATPLSPATTEPVACAAARGCVSRRDSLLLAGVAVVGTASLAACGEASDAVAGAASSAASAAGGAIAEADIPVGGGKVFEALKVVVTQPTDGEYKAFSAVCTHQGCTVKGVGNGVITCPCHGS